MRTWRTQDARCRQGAAREVKLLNARTCRGTGDTWSPIREATRCRQPGSGREPAEPARPGPLCSTVSLLVRVDGRSEAGAMRNSLKKKTTYMSQAPKSL